jgi:hypothetical protein
MVEEDERLEGGSAPPQFSCTQQVRGQSFPGLLQHPSAAAVSGQISEPQVPAVAEKVQKLLPRQQSLVVQQFDLEGGSAPPQFSCTQQDRGAELFWSAAGSLGSSWFWADFRAETSCRGRESEKNAAAAAVFVGTAAHL